MIGSLGKVVVEGELLARELLTLHPLDAEKGQKFSKILWEGGGHMPIDKRARDLKDQFKDVFGNAITNFVYVHLMCVLCCVVLCVCVPLTPSLLPSSRNKHDF